MVSRKRSQEPAQPLVEGPARLHTGHHLDRLLAPVAGAPRGYRNRNEHPLSAAFDPDAPKISADEFAAGEVYRTFFEAMGPSGRDSTEFIVVSGSRSPFTDAQVNAIRMVEAIEIELKKLAPGDPWVIVVRKFCGEAWDARSACVAAGIGDPRKTWETIRLALSKLSTAISRTRIDFRTGD